VVLIDVVVPALPKVASRTPLVEPVAQNRLPSSVTAPRGLPPLNASIIAVEESRLPAPSIRAITRFTAEAVVPATLAVPGVAS
jgi:hypothetical protein